MFEEQATRRAFIKHAAYVAPVIITLPAVASFASAGSGEGSHSVHGSPDALAPHAPHPRGLTSH